MAIKPMKRSLSAKRPSLIWITLAAIIIYSNIFHSPFVFDDESSIKDNLAIRNLSGYLSIEKLLERRAIVDLSFAINYKLDKLNVFSYHLINVFIHVFNGFLVYLLASLIFRRLSTQSTPLNFSPSGMALFGSLIFVTHPIQTQAITYPVQRYTSMAALFYLMSVFFYLKARITGVQSGTEVLRGRIITFYAISFFSGALAFMSKESAASLPVAILIAEYVIIDRTWKEWRRMIPWFTTAFILWILFILHVSGFFGNEVEHKDWLERVSDLSMDVAAPSRWIYLCTQFNVIVIYIRLLFLPIGQSFDHFYPFRTGFFDGYTWLAFLFLLGIIGLGIWQVKKRPTITFGIFWFFITLLVESSIIPIKDALSEHRLYLPMFGFALIFSPLVFHIFSKKRSLTLIIPALIILSLGTTTYKRNQVWKNPARLWTEALSRNPSNYRAHLNFGNILLRQGQIEEAKRHYLEVLRLKPHHVKAYNNLGVALEKQGRIDEAIKHYLEALRIDPNYEKTHNNLGVALFRKGDVEKAVAHFREALRLRPDHVNAKNNLRDVLIMMNRM